MLLPPPRMLRQRQLPSSSITPSPPTGVAEGHNIASTSWTFPHTSTTSPSPPMRRFQEHPQWHYRSGPQHQPTLPPEIWAHIFQDATAIHNFFETRWDSCRDSIVTPFDEARSLASPQVSSYYTSHSSSYYSYLSHSSSAPSALEIFATCLRGYPFSLLLQWRMNVHTRFHFTVFPDRYPSAFHILFKPDHVHYFVISIQLRSTPPQRHHVAGG